MSEKSAWWISPILLLALVPPLYAQGTVAKKEGADAQPAGSQTSPPTAPTSASGAPDLVSRLDSIDAKLTQWADKDKNKPTDYTPAWIGLVGTVVGGAITLITQLILANRAAKKDLAAAAARAKLDTASAVIQWQLKQLSELYGPLQALLRESQTLYQQMRTVLVNQDRTRFRPLQASQDSLRADHGFEIHRQGKWISFRSVLHLDHIYGKGYGIDLYMDSIVSCGECMVKLIQGKAGYLRPDQAELGYVFGQYLAHFSVLKSMHAYCASSGSMARDPNSRPITTDAAAFPGKFDQLVSAGFTQIVEDLSQWQAMVGATPPGWLREERRRSEQSTD